MLPLRYRVDSQAPTEDNANCKFLYDNKASRFGFGPPEYTAITPVIKDGYIDEFWSAQFQTFSAMAPPGLTIDQLASLFHLVNTDYDFAIRFGNISNEANARFPTDFEASLLPERAAYRASATRADLVFLVKKTTTVLGLVSSDSVVPKITLEVQEEALGLILRHLHRLRYALSHSALCSSSAFVCHWQTNNHEQKAILFLVYSTQLSCAYRYIKLPPRDRKATPAQKRREGLTKLKINLNKLFYASRGHVLQRINEPGGPPSFRLQLHQQWAVAHRADLLGYVTQSAQANREAEALHAAAERFMNEEEAGPYAQLQMLRIE